MKTFNWGLVVAFVAILLVVFLIALPFFTGGLSRGYGYGMMGPWHMGGYNMMGGFGLFGGLMMLGALIIPLGLIALLVVGIVALVRAASGTAQPTRACPNCGKPVQSGWVACPNCGQKL